MINSPLVQKVTAAKEAYVKVHDDLLAQCRDKKYDITDRFETWENLIEKINHPYVYHFDAKTPSCVQDYEDGLEYKYEIHDYGCLLDYAYDHVEWEAPTCDFSKPEQVKAYNEAFTLMMNTHPDIIELKEWLIKENFGSFKFDW